MRYKSDGSRRSGVANIVMQVGAADGRVRGLRLEGETKLTRKALELTSLMTEVRLTRRAISRMGPFHVGMMA